MNSAIVRRRVALQGFSGLTSAELQTIGPCLRFTPALNFVVNALGTVLRSPVLLLSTAECLRLKQPLGYSASGAREQGDSAWYVLQLDDSGTVSRPLFPKWQREQWTRRSRWTTKADTLLILVSDGLVGPAPPA